MSERVSVRTCKLHRHRIAGKYKLATRGAQLSLSNLNLSAVAVPRERKNPRRQTRSDPSWKTRSREKLLPYAHETLNCCITKRSLRRSALRGTPAHAVDAAKEKRKPVTPGATSCRSNKIIPALTFAHFLRTYFYDRALVPSGDRHRPETSKFSARGKNHGGVA